MSTLLPGECTPQYILQTVESRTPLFLSAYQRAKKVVSDSLGLVDFAIGLVFFVLCPTGKCCFFGKFKLQKDCYQSCQSKRALGIVEMTCWLVHAIYSLPEWQAVKLTFFAPWHTYCISSIKPPQGAYFFQALI